MCKSSSLASMFFVLHSLRLNKWIPNAYSATVRPWISEIIFWAGMGYGLLLGILFSPKFSRRVPKLPLLKRNWCILLLCIGFGQSSVWSIWKRWLVWNTYCSFKIFLWYSCCGLNWSYYQKRSNRVYNYQQW